MQARRDQDFFWEGIDRGELLAQQCDECGQLRHPPQPMCAACGSNKWHGVRLSGEGTILANIESVHPTRRDEEPRCVCLVELPEGLRMVSSVLDPENAENGVPVKFEITEYDGQLLPMVRTAGGGQ
ncbi:MAG: nucleic acid-binding protein [Alphaproteobacteria bacterium]|nr:nucleic acid-binding protein [Alphaproteobacteria bacterium]